MKTTAISLLLLFFAFPYFAQTLKINQPQYIVKDLKKTEITQFLEHATEDVSEKLRLEVLEYSNPSYFPICLQKSTFTPQEAQEIQKINAIEFFHDEKYILLQINDFDNEDIPMNCKSKTPTYYIVGERKINAISLIDDDGKTVEVYDTLNQCYHDQLIFNDKTKIDGKVIGKLNLNDWLSENYTQEFLGVIKKYGVEVNWPDGMKSSELREKNKEEIAKLNAFPMMGMLMEDKKIYGVVWVPYSRNQHVAENLRPKNKEGFFMAIDMNYSSEESVYSIVIPLSHFK